MGDPRKARKQYRTPTHPWQKARLEEENKLAIDYGLKNKEEIWKIGSILSNFTHQSKKLVTLSGAQAEKEKTNMIKKLKRIGLLKESQNFDDILSLTIKDVLERRLQTLVHRKGLARTMKQARQMITHSQIMVGKKKIESPSYIVGIDEENTISFNARSPFSSQDHPEIAVKENQKKKADKKEEKKESKDKKEEPEEKKEKSKSKPKKSKEKKESKDKKEEPKQEPEKEEKSEEPKEESKE